MKAKSLNQLVSDAVRYDHNHDRLAARVLLTVERVFDREIERHRQDERRKLAAQVANVKLAVLDALSGDEYEDG